MKFTSSYVCQQCGYQSPSFLGKCPNCGEWNSLVEEVKSEKLKVKSESQKPKVIKLSEITVNQTRRVSTGISELDRVLGGGLVPGMAVLLAGEPGIGKSTLLLQLADSVGTSRRGGMPPQILYIAGEESASQIKIRANRLGIKGENLEILETTDVDGVVGASRRGGTPVQLIIIDSIQTMTTADLSGTAGSVGQVRECAARLIGEAKRQNTPLFLVGHVTKEGSIAGPKVLEHAVDTVLNFEGERDGRLRLIRATKNRFGPTDEVGIFEMTDRGLGEMGDLGKIGGSGGVGSCLTVTMEGTRPMVVEIQALTTQTPLPAPRRVANGIEYNRLLMIVAVLQKRLNVPLYKEDIYVTVSGGIKIDETASDLAVALAILSSYRGKELPVKAVAVGEIDLLGGVRVVREVERRIKEAKRLGYENILSPTSLHNLSTFRFSS